MYTPSDTTYVYFIFLLLAISVYKRNLKRNELVYLLIMCMTYQYFVHSEFCINLVCLLIREIMSLIISHSVTSLRNAIAFVYGVDGMWTQQYLSVAKWPWVSCLPLFRT